MRFRQAALLVIVLSAAAVLAGCSGGGSQFMPNPSPTPSPTPNPTPNPTPTPTPTPSISVSLNITPASLQINGTTQFTATVSNDPQNAGVNWTVTCTTSGSGCGSFSATTTTSGIATAFTAPGVVPVNNTVTVTATSVTDATMAASATLTITPPALADGTYVFHVTGEDSATSPPGPYVAAGAFSVVSGTITGGEQDFVDANGAVSSTNLGGSLGGTADGNFQITITSTGAGVNGTETMNGAMVSTTNAQIGEFDGFATSHGTLQLQVAPIAPPSGGYAFDATGLDGSNPRARVSLGGIINVDGSGTISGAGSVFDINDGSLPAPLASQSFAASTVTAPDAFGRVLFSLVPNASSGIAPINLVGYIANAQNIQVVETSDTFGGVMGGTAFSQNPNTGSFTTASVAGSSFVISAFGVDTQGLLQLAGVLTTNSDGSTVSGTVNFNDLSGAGTQSPINVSGTYTVDPTGRVTLSNITDGSSINATLQFYLSGKSISVGISMDAGDILAANVFKQTGGGSFTAASFSGNYAMTPHGFDVNNKLEVDFVGTASVDGVSALTATVDQNVMTPPPSQTPGISISGTFNANASGVFTGTITGFDVTTASNADSFTYYVVDTTRVIAIETDPNQLTVINFALQR